MDTSEHSRVSEWDELEARSLVDAHKNGAQDTLPNPARSSFLRKQIQIFLFLALCVFVTIFKEDILGLILLEKEEQGEVIGKIPIEEVQRTLLEGKKIFDELNKKDYGDYAEKIFNKSAVSKYFKSPYDVPKFGHTVDKSRERLKRRMKIKIIESQISKDPTTFTWAIGGHSAAAGHGNLFRQASANVMEQSLKGVLGSLGITFRAKNYAMGGTSSGPEVAMCMESIFGRDIDILSWDYGMTDAGRHDPKYKLWTQRAGVHPSRPILFSFGQRYSEDIHNGFVNAGGAAFESNYADVKKIFPNSDDLDVNVTQLPPAVKDYICSGHAETGDPCGENDVKFDTKHTCPNIGHQVSWHNGWKDHLFIGRIAAAFILESFLEALDDLSKGGDDVGEAGEEDGEKEGNEENDRSVNLASSLRDPESVMPNTKPEISALYLDELKMFEDKDKAAFFASEPPSGIFPESNGNDFNFTVLERSRGMCRVSLLPSQARFDGLLGSGNASDYLYGGKHDYVEEGYDYMNLPKGVEGVTELPLVYNHLNNRKLCKEAEIDFKDIFYIRDEDDWVKTSLPNTKEKAYFGKIDFQGAIMMCTLVFDWGNYPKDYVQITDFFNKSIATQGGILVNGHQAVSSIKLENAGNQNCHVLKHGGDGDAYKFPVEDDSSPFEFQLKVPRKDGNVYLTSIIVL